MLNDNPLVQLVDQDYGQKRASLQGRKDYCHSNENNKAGESEQTLEQNSDHAKHEFLLLPLVLVFCAGQNRTACLENI